MLYTEELWTRYVEKVEDNFKIKTYPHFDPYFNFPKDKDKLHVLVKDITGKSIAEHSFLPLIKILIKTPRYRYQENEKNYNLETKIRPISFASHFDNYIYGFYSFAINEIYQQYIRKNGFDDCVLAYRSDLDGKCNIQFAKEVFDNIKSQKLCSAIALDIKGYFDNIDHKILKEKWCKVIDKDNLPDDQYKIYRTLTKYSYVNKNSVLKHFEINLNKLKKQKVYWQSLLDLIPDEIAGNSFKDKFNLLRQDNLIVTNKPKKNKDGSITFKGIPQGSAMSALLSNIYLIDFDKYLKELGLKIGFLYRRYCDDLIVVCPTDKVNEIKDIIIKEILNKYNLIIQDKKTEIIDFKPNEKGIIRGFKRKFDKETNLYNTLENKEINYKNLQYLGFEFNGQKTYIRPGSLSRYFRKMKGRIVKSVMMAYSKNSKSSVINKQQIYHRYSHLGKRNFLQYAYNASKKYYKNSEGKIREGLDSSSIKRQISAHFSIIEQEIRKTSEQRAGQLKNTTIKY
ncbi:MAG: hypothetical protein H6536_04120 [Bacteroidales bacterium]|nr:hypothetical protein [Bacteroidales bacterium]